MPTRRQVRETAVQLIYSTDFNGCEDPQSGREAFWEIVQEEDRLRLSAAQLKALVHLSSGRSERRNRLHEKLDEALPHLLGIEATEPLRIALEKSLADETRWLKMLEQVGKKLKSKTESDRSEISADLEELLALDQGISSRREEIFRLMEDLPGFKARLEGLVSALVKLSRISERIQVITRPEGYADHPGLAHLKTAHEDVTELRNAVEDLVSKVGSHQDQIDEKIARLSENFEAERINPVDRCILRLGAYEILFVDDVPNPVAINEALEIAKAFSGQKSHQFINGILDKLAKA